MDYNTFDLQPEEMRLVAITEKQVELYIALMFQIHRVDEVVNRNLNVISDWFHTIKKEYVKFNANNVNEKYLDIALANLIPFLVFDDNTPLDKAKAT